MPTEHARGQSHIDIHIKYDTLVSHSYGYALRSYVAVCGGTRKCIPYPCVDRCCHLGTGTEPISITARHVCCSLHEKSIYLSHLSSNTLRLMLRLRPSRRVGTTREAPSSTAHAHRHHHCCAPMASVARDPVPFAKSLHGGVSSPLHRSSVML